jgi:cystathionine beta-lyase/cystathionine gamma-synthase
MKTYFVRREAQCASAGKVAAFLQEHPRVARVRYPGLPGDPGHERALRQMTDFGSLVTFDHRGGTGEGDRFAESLELFSIAASLGSTESLVLPPGLLQPRAFTAEQRAWSGIGPGTVRLSIGVEDVDDLVDDLRRALERHSSDG